MRAQRRGLGGFVYFGEKLPPLLPESQVAAFFGEVNRIRSGTPEHGRNIRLEELRREPQFFQNRSATFSPRQALDA